MGLRPQLPQALGARDVLSDRCHRAHVPAAQWPSWGLTGPSMCVYLTALRTHAQKHWWGSS